MTYKDFINNIIDTRGQWTLEETGGYFEAHHIIPKCLGGKGDIRKGRKYTHHENIIFLYPEEHYEAHKLLALENPSNKSLVKAWSMMAFPKGKTKRAYEIGAEDYGILKRLLSEQARLNNNFLKNGEPWNKGLTKETDPRLKLVSEKSKGKNTWTKGLKRTEQQKKHLSDVQKKRHLEHPTESPIKGKKAITDGSITTYVNKTDEIPAGFIEGQCPKAKYVIKDYETFCKKAHDRSVGEKNNNYGHGERQSGGRNGHATILYAFEGIDYYCRKDLLLVLKQRWPDISTSTIRKIINNSYSTRIVKKFSYIIENLTWRLKTDEDKKY